MSDRVTVHPNVQPIYEHIAVADFYQLERVEKILNGEIFSGVSLDMFEIQLLMKQVNLRRKELATEAGSARCAPRTPQRGVPTNEMEAVA